MSAHEILVFLLENCPTILIMAIPIFSIMGAIFLVVTAVIEAVQFFGLKAKGPTISTLVGILMTISTTVGADEIAAWEVKADAFWPALDEDYNGLDVDIWVGRVNPDIDCTLITGRLNRVNVGTRWNFMCTDARKPDTVLHVVSGDFHSSQTECQQPTLEDFKGP